MQSSPVKISLLSGHGGHENVDLINLWPLQSQLVTQVFGLIIFFLQNKVADAPIKVVEIKQVFGVILALVKCEILAYVTCDVAQGLEAFDGLLIQVHFGGGVFANSLL